MIDERDRYMAARLREAHDPAQREVLAVVGAGHLQGLAQYLETDTDAPGPLRESLEAVPKKRNIPWFTLTILAIVLAGIAGASSMAAWAWAASCC